jgi:hypothetical protein
MRTARLLLTALLLAAPPSAAPLAAQRSEPPHGWKVRTDKPDASASDIQFVGMPPGWHITTGPAAIFYEPGRTAEGTYRIQSTIYLFDPGRRHAEAYGVFFGGRDLEGDGEAYSYFLIRDTGDFLVKRRRGADTETVVPWTHSDAIMKHPGGGEQAKNTLVVELGAENVDFYINGQKATGVPRSKLDTEGVVGLRINHMLNVHVSELEVSPSAGATR